MTVTTMGQPTPAAEVIGETRIAPSILAADYARLGAQVSEVLAAGARVVHCAVMDGHFVPPITFGSIVVSALSDQIHAVGGVIDVHLMIERPEGQVEAFAAAGADCITFHAEATPHAARTISLIREHGAAAAVAINPATPVAALTEIAHDLDMVLCMTVNPGWGGQRFIAHSIDKIGRLRSLVGDEVPLQVDGGIDTETAAPCRQAGASVFVAGSAIFKAADPGESYRAIAAAAGAL